MIIILGIAAVVFAVGWLATYISMLAFIWYLQEKNVPLPESADLRRGTKWAVSRMFRKLIRR